MNTAIKPHDEAASTQKLLDVLDQAKEIINGQDGDLAYKAMLAHNLVACNVMALTGGHAICPPSGPRSLRNIALERVTDYLRTASAKREVGAV
jgi:hypothetical protein